MMFVELAIGFVLLVAGGEALVRGAGDLAKRLGVSSLMIGLTVVGFGTSVPELVTSLQAAFSGSPGIAVGNVVGSNITNILLILGLAAIMRPFAVGEASFRRDGTAVVLAALACAAVIVTGALSRAGGLTLLTGLVVYIAVVYRSERTAVVRSAAGDAAPAPIRGSLWPILLAMGGMALTVLGARLLVGAATDLAADLGVSEAVIGLTVVAVGTSLPELVTSIVAALRRQGDIAFGNVIGSNIYNVLGILGVTALARPIEVPARIASVDVWVMLAATAALVIVAVSGWRVTRAEGAALLAAYVAYIGWLAMA